MIRNAPWLVLLLAGIAHAKYARVEVKDLPVDRVIKNLTQATTTSPQNFNAWLNLGRAHAMAATLESETAPVKMRSDEEFWFGYQAPLIPFPKKTLAPGAAHLKAALDAYQKADAIKPNTPMVVAGLGWLLERSGRIAEAIEKYRAALRLTWSKEKDDDSSFGSTLSGEIIGYLKPLLDAKRDADELEDLDEKVARIGRMGRLITPIAVPLEDGLTPADVQRASPVTFDADGSGFARAWTWVQPNAGWLVFAPTAHVDSALQLFGSVTFWMFWSDGYEALASLDDDGSGALTGAELEGLAVWRDANSNGVNEPGELASLQELGIVAVSCRGSASTAVGVVAGSERGVTFADGTSRPTWDLLLRQVPAVATAR